MTDEQIAEIAMTCGIIPNLNPVIFEFAHLILEQDRKERGRLKDIMPSENQGELK